MVLVIDEYHLDIRAEDELVSRYYLADVEVARDIAERFILFLNDGEMEFLADDALKFAYDGVAAMQEAWLAAQKKRRRHRKAAVQSARRKDRELAPEPDPIPQHVVSEPDRPQRSRQGERQAPAAAPSELAKRLAAAAAPVAPPARVLKAPVPASPPPAAASSRNGKGRNRKAGSPAPAPAPVLDEPEPAPLAPIELPSPFDAVDEVSAVVVPVPAKEAKRAKKRKPVEEAPVQPPRTTRLKELPVIEPEPVEPPAPVEDPLEVRFAADGHHPAETSVGLLSRLRRQPKIPDNHIHRFRESGSGVGLVRRVCIECSYVSISSND